MLTVQQLGQDCQYDPLRVWELSVKTDLTVMRAWLNIEKKQILLTQYSVISYIVLNYFYGTFVLFGN